MYEFEALWTIEGTQVEEGNVKPQSGESHVVRTTLMVAGESRVVYVKKQTNYATALSRLLNSRSSLCRREYQNILAWHSMGLPTMEAVYCGEVQNPLRGILVTLALEGYAPMDEGLARASAKERAELLQEAAKLIRRIHAAGWVHRCFFPKHVFVSQEKVSEPLRMIDLEKARKTWFPLRDEARDMGSFVRRIEWESEAEWQLFFDTYFGCAKQTLYRRIFMYLVGQRMAQKKARRQKAC